MSPQQQVTEPAKLAERVLSSQRSKTQVCTPVDPCDGATTYEAQTPTTTQDRICSNMTECVPGEYVLTPGTETTNRVCESCTAGIDYSTTTNAASCTGVTNACDGTTTYETQAPTVTQDRTCSNMTECVAGEYVLTAGSATTNRICEACTAGTDYSTTTNAASCTGVTNECDGVTVYETQAPTVTQNRICSNMTECVAGEYVLTAGSSTTNRICAACTAGTDFSTATNAASCIGVTNECDGVTVYETQAPSVTQDRICSNMTECVPG